MKEELPERYFLNKSRVVKIGQILKNTFPKQNNSEKMYQCVKDAWKHGVDDKTYLGTIVTGFKNGILYVVVESSVMTHYLTNFKKNAIIFELNKIIGTNYIEDIRFKVGNLNEVRRK